MKFLDAHCDTIVKIVDEGAGFAAGPGLQVTLEGLRSAGVRVQVFACCVPEARDPGHTRERALELVAAVRTLCANQSSVVLAEHAGEAAGALGGDGPVSVIVSLEGADPLEGDAEALREFHRRGVRLLTLAWDDNPFCGSTYGDGVGLSAKGEELVQFCEELGVMVDVSPASDAAFSDVCRVATRPFVASHSDCRALCSAARNLTDEMIRALAERGGVMGINLASGFLSQSFHDQERGSTSSFWKQVRSGQKSFDEAGEEAARAVRKLPRPPLDLVAAHVRHAIMVGGEDCVGLGGDLDGIDSTPLGIEGVGDYPKIAALLLQAGLSEAQVEKVCWRNFARVLGAEVPPT